MQSLLIQRIGQRAHYMVLPHQLVEGFGAPFAGKNLIAHGMGKLNLVRLNFSPKPLVGSSA
jgi:hypothetical protein